MAPREGYWQGAWMAGSETDKLEKANANKRFLADRDTEYNQLVEEQKTGTGRFSADYQAKHGDMFKSFLNERIAGQAGGTGFAEAYNYAGQDRFKQFLTPITAPAPTPATATTAVTQDTPQASPTAVNNGYNFKTIKRGYPAFNMLRDSMKPRTR